MSGLERPSLRAKESSHAQAKRVYVNRASGSNCYYRIIDKTNEFCLVRSHHNLCENRENEDHVFF